MGASIVICISGGNEEMKKDIRSTFILIGGRRGDWSQFPLQKGVIFFAVLTHIFPAKSGLQSNY